MYVNEFSRRLGLPASKVRYYDRSGMYQGQRGANNYRDFTDNDALDAYLAQSLRSIDLSMEETTLAVRSYEPFQMYHWLTGRIGSLREEITMAQAKLERLEQLREFTVAYGTNLPREEAFPGRALQEHAVYSIRTFGSYTKVNDEVLEAAAALGGCMPYSYIALSIPGESLFRGEAPLPVGIGLGIREKNLERFGLTPSPVMDCFPGGPHLILFLEREDVFHLTCADLRPLLDGAAARGLRLRGDLTGRISFAREKEGRRFYCLSVRCRTEPL